jgi:hypothetical protein
MAANDWNAPQSFLRRLFYAGYVDDVYTSLNNGTLKRYLPGGLETAQLAPGEVADAIADIFHADPALYVEAEAVHRRYVPNPSPSPPPQPAARASESEPHDPVA